MCSCALPSTPCSDSARTQAWSPTSGLPGAARLAQAQAGRWALPSRCCASAQSSPHASPPLALAISAVWSADHRHPCPFPGALRWGHWVSLPHPTCRGLSCQENLSKAVWVIWTSPFPSVKWNWATGHLLPPRDHGGESQRLGPFPRQQSDRPRLGSASTSLPVTPGRRLLCLDAPTHGSQCWTREGGLPACCSGLLPRQQSASSWAGLAGLQRRGAG